MKKKRFEVTLPDDNPIWKVPKGTRSKIVDEALRRYFGQAESNTDVAASIKELTEVLKEILTEARNGALKSNFTPQSEQDEEKPVPTDYLCRVIRL